MDNRDYAIIGLLLVIIAMLSYGVINAYNDSQPEVFEFSDYIVTAPAGSHYHNNSDNPVFYLSENEVYSMFAILKNDSFTVEEFDIMYNGLKNGSVSKSDFLNMMNSGPEDNSSLVDVNVGDFRGEPEISMIVQNTQNQSRKGLIHFVKHNNDKVFMIAEEMDNPSATQMYNNLVLK